ncbi:MAG TPA: sugar kinase [Opitutales bacterium]|nr:sugar kinase [Opitutales bacterium]
MLSAVPDDAIGRSCLAGLRRFGPGVSHVVASPGRLGTFYLETGAHLRPSQCIYDRAGSVFAETPFEAYGAEKLFAASPGGWLHLSGTMSALSPNCRTLARRLVSAAKAAGLTVSFDLNYRARLWGKEEARAAFRELVPVTDVLIANEGVAEDFLGAPAADLCGKYGLLAACLTNRRDIDASRTVFGARMFRPGGTAVEASAREFGVLDRVGGGDAFAGAMIWTLQQKEWDDARRIAFAAACGVLKHETHGDFSLSTREEVEAFLAGGDAAIRR